MKTLTCSWCDALNATGATTCASCGAPLREEGARLVMESVARALPPDTVLRDGDYKILAILGQGGFGITYRALNSRLGREVAIKEFFPSSCDREGLLVSPSGGTTAIDYENGKAAFLSEARVLARFDHPAIVRVFGAWEENRSAYMEMELLRGQTLSHVLDQYRRLNANDVLRLFGPILDALQVLHNEGYLHRDIKPQNLMLCGVAQGATDAESCVRHARAVLLDFGAAHHVGSGASQALSVVVTPGYAPLEQYAQRARRGAFTDIYALCATLYHALSGQTPPPASDRAIGQALTPLEDLVSGLPKEWYRAIDAGLQTEIAKRPQSVSELRALMGNQTPSAPPPYQPYQTAPKPYGADDLSAQMTPLPPHQIGFGLANTQAQSLIAQSLLNAVPDPSAPQVLAAPNLNPQHPLGSNAPGQPVALSQPSSAVPLVPPQASQNAQTPYQQPSAAQQHAQNQAQLNNATNDVRMRQIAALLYLGSPIVFALLWWLFAVSSGPHIVPVPAPPMEMPPPPITRPYNPPPSAPMSSQEVLPKMRFSMANSAQSSLSAWKPARFSSQLYNAVLSPDGERAAAIDDSGQMRMWKVNDRKASWQLGQLSADKTAYFAFSPDSSKLVIGEIEVAALGGRTVLPAQISSASYDSVLLSVADTKNGKILWHKPVRQQLPVWSNDSQKLHMVFTFSGLQQLMAATGEPVGSYRTDVLYADRKSAEFSSNGNWSLQHVSSNQAIIDAIGRQKNWQWVVNSDQTFRTGSFLYAPDSSWVMADIFYNRSKSERRVAFFDLKTGKVISSWPHEPSRNYGSEFDFTISPQGRYVVIRHGTSALRIWDVRTHNDVFLQWDKGNHYKNSPLPEAELLGNRVAFSPDGSKMVIIDGDLRKHVKVRLIDLTTLEIREMKSPSSASNLQMQFTPDGSFIAWIDAVVGEMGRMKVSDFKTSVPVQVFNGHGATVSLLQGRMDNFKVD